MNSTIHVNYGLIYYDQPDHCPTVMNFILPNSVKVNKYINDSTTPYSESKKNMSEELTKIEVNWRNILASNNVDNMLHKLGSIIENLHGKCFLKKTKQLTYKRLNNP